MKPVIIFLFYLLLACPYASSQSQYDTSWASLDSRPVPGWFGKAKFGIFIHWGLYSVPAWATDSYADGFGSNYAEWYWQRLFAPQLKIHKDFTEFHNRVYGPEFKYPDFASRFQCELFDPAEWADLFVKSGAKYVVLTSKHHDGYCLWPSQQAWNWNAVDNGPAIDLVGAVTEAVRGRGLRMGLYYSLYEWFHPLYKSDVNTYVGQHMLPQMFDLVRTYRPDVFWADGDWEHPSAVWKTREFCAWLYNESPVKNSIVVNDRLGNDINSRHGTFSTSEYGRGHQSTLRPWEETRGIGQSFGYNRNESLKEYATSKELIHQLIRIVAGGGNFLLNVGPDADGTIPVIMQQRLIDIGDWLAVNGDAIYETTAWINGSAKATGTAPVYFTAKENHIFAFLTDWQETMEITSFPLTPVSVRLLGYAEPLSFTYRNGNLRVKMPPILPGKSPCDHAWTLQITHR